MKKALAKNKKDLSGTVRRRKVIRRPFPKSPDTQIKMDEVGYDIGVGYNIEYMNGDNIYKHRLKKCRVIVGNGFILLVDKSIKMTSRGIIGG